MVLNLGVKTEICNPTWWLKLLYTKYGSISCKCCV